MDLRVRLCLSLFSFLLSYPAIAAEPKGPLFGEGSLQFGKKSLTVEIAETDEQHEFGLMFRRHLAPQHGMIFIFPDEAPRSFWMKNTFVELSIGYFDGNKRLVDIQDMKAVRSVLENPQVYPSRGPAQYALEVNQGWFKKNGVKIGDRFILKRKTRP